LIALEWGKVVWVAANEHLIVAYFVAIPLIFCHV
jgi:hypothetical protein